MKFFIAVLSIFFIFFSKSDASSNLSYQASLDYNKSTNSFLPFVEFSKDPFTQLSIFPGHTLGSWGNSGAFAALREDKRVITWGDRVNGGDSKKVQDRLFDVKKIYSNSYAFAALKENGEVVTWGRDIYGGDSRAVEEKLNNIVAIFSTKKAFAALKRDGEVVTWGGFVSGGDSKEVAKSLKNIKTIFSSECAFAALKKNGEVVTWGSSECGGDSSKVKKELKDVVVIYSTAKAFAALKSNGDVVVWGNKEYGGDTLDFNLHKITKLYSNQDSFVAINTNQEAFIWGGKDKNSLIVKNVKEVVPSLYNFTIIKNNNIALSLTKNKQKNYLRESISKIYANNVSFSALTLKNRVILWGDSGYKNPLELPIKADKIKYIYSNAYAFVALKKDKSVESWGYKEAGGELTKELKKQLKDIHSISSSGSKELYPSGAFAALKENGEVVTWGSKAHGGDSSSVKKSLHNIIYITSYNKTSF